MFTANKTMFRLASYNDLKQVPNNERQPNPHRFNIILSTQGQNYPLLIFLTK